MGPELMQFKREQVRVYRDMPEDELKELQRTTLIKLEGALKNYNAVGGATRGARAGKYFGEMLALTGGQGFDAVYDVVHKYLGDKFASFKDGFGGEYAAGAALYDAMRAVEAVSPFRFELISSGSQDEHKGIDYLAYLTHQDSPKFSYEMLFNAKTMPLRLNREVSRMTNDVSYKVVNNRNNSSSYDPILDLGRTLTPAQATERSKQIRDKIMPADTYAARMNEIMLSCEKTRQAAIENTRPTGIQSMAYLIVVPRPEAVSPAIGKGGVLDDPIQQKIVSYLRIQLGIDKKQ